MHWLVISISISRLTYRFYPQGFFYRTLRLNLPLFPLIRACMLQTELLKVEIGIVHLKWFIYLQRSQGAKQSEDSDICTQVTRILLNRKKHLCCTSFSSDKRYDSFLSRSPSSTNSIFESRSWVQDMIMMLSRATLKCTMTTKTTISRPASVPSNLLILQRGKAKS